MLDWVMSSLWEMLKHSDDRFIMIHFLHEKYNWIETKIIAIIMHE